MPGTVANGWLIPSGVKRTMVVAVAITNRSFAASIAIPGELELAVKTAGESVQCPDPA